MSNQSWEVRLSETCQGNVQVVQEPDQAVVAFACEDAAALPQGDFRPHSSL